MAKHTILTENQVRDIALSFSIKISNYRPIEAGEANTSYLLEDSNDQYVLTIFETKTKKEVLEIAKILDYLKGHNYPTTKLISPSNNHRIHEFEGKPLLIKKWIQGGNLRENPIQDYLPIGESLAILHKIPAPSFLSREHPFGIIEMPKSLGHGIDPGYEIWLQDKIAYINKYLPSSLPKCFIHGDLFDDNILVDQREFISIIDFEDSCKYFRAYDLGSILFGVCIEKGKLNKSRASQILKGYQKISKLKSEEIDAIQFFTIYAGAAISAWHYMAYNIQHPNPKMKNWHQQTMRKTEQIFQMTKEEFSNLIN
ncbi:MAG: phosphotransferase [Chloroflexi bacterium]|jgi:homoserine kinase type II|nr:phosphotransferase [Chloroflexota bacterium]MBT4003947.1 phosphotransferase [Chloroflexota bacterium]MBT4305747.1 phosphotransferase [Chloroflexota bacterium]MBT4533571.1 phosphotransferase [Chloroflexota bacterium]MBT4681786.1 phosphotransferase [Chloroflexota bacterium]